MASEGLLYLNGTCVKYESFGGVNITEFENRETSKKTFKIGFKQRMQIYDAITLQNHMAAMDNHLNHCFLTLTFRRGNVPDKPNKCVGFFFESLKKKGFKNYVWTREVGSKGKLLHYHFTTVGPRYPIRKVNDIWSHIRGDWATNAVRSSINPYTGKAQMVINNLTNARWYTAKYMTKGVDPELNIYPGRIWARSNELKREPLKLSQALDLAYHPYYGSDGKVFHSDYVSIGRVRPDLAMSVYSEWHEILSRKPVEPEIKPKARNLQASLFND